MRKPLHLRSRFESVEDAIKRDKKVAKVAKDHKTSWSGAVRIIIDAHPTK